MQQKNTYDPFGAELRRFADQLDRRQFRTVNSGFGYADIVRRSDYSTPTTPHQHITVEPIRYPRTEPPQRQRETPQRFDEFRPEAFAPAPPSKTQEVARAPQPRPFVPTMNYEVFSPVNAPSPDLVKPRRRPGVLGWAVKHLIAHSLDVITVGVSFLISIMIGGLVFAPQSGSNHWQSIVAWTPVQMIMGMSLLHVVLMVYGLYVLYWLFLRLAVGGTLGHTLLGISRPVQK